MMLVFENYTNLAEKWLATPLPEPVQATSFVIRNFVRQLPFINHKNCDLSKRGRYARYRGIVMFYEIK